MASGFFETYLDTFSDPSSSDPEHRNKPIITGRNGSCGYGTPDDEFRSENGGNTNNHGVCSGVPDRNSGVGEAHDNDHSAPCSEPPGNVSPSKSNGRSSTDAPGWRGRI